MLPLLRTYLGPLWRRSLLLLALLLLGVGLELAGPQILRQFIDSASGGAASAALVWLALLYLAAALLGQGVTLAESYLAGALGWDATNRLRADLMRHCLRLDPPFFAANPPGALVARVDGDVTRLSRFFSELLVRLAGNALLLVGVLVLTFALDWRAGLGMLGFVAVTSGLLYGLRGLAVGRWERESRANAELFGFLEERLSGTEDLRALGAVGYAEAGLARRDRELLLSWRRAQVLGSAPFALTLVMLAAGAALALGLGGWLYLQGAITLGSAYLLFAYAELLRRPIEEIGRQIQELQQAGASVLRIDELRAQRSLVADGPGAALPAGPLDVAFDGVSFEYRDAQPADGRPAGVLHDISFELAPGQVLGLLGRTGSGKSTIARLLFRLYDPQAGAVRLGGQPLPALRLAELRARVGMVTQDIQLFHGTLRDNLTLFDPSVPDARIGPLLAELGLGEWLARQPQGLDTLIAPDGANLSAGEAQLLAFARVFLKDPGLVILDEASSRLDPATERLVERAIDRLLAGRTALIIAHRLSTVRRADRIMVLEAGHIREQGPRAALAADPSSRFAELLRAGLDPDEANPTKASINAP